MNATDPDARKVWECTLMAVRSERRRRRIRLTVLGTTAAGLLTLLLFPRDTPSAPARLAGPPMKQAHGILAVLVIRNGIPMLESMTPRELPNTELRFSLEPVLADYRDLSDEGL